MKEARLLVLCYWICLGVLSAQDIIVLNSGDEIEALVQEVGPNEVQYKKYAFQDAKGACMTVMGVIFR